MANESLSSWPSGRRTGSGSTSADFEGRSNHLAYPTAQPGAPALVGNVDSWPSSAPAMFHTRGWALGMGPLLRERSLQLHTLAGAWAGTDRSKRLLTAATKAPLTAINATTHRPAVTGTTADGFFWGGLLNEMSLNPLYAVDTRGQPETRIPD